MNDTSSTVTVKKSLLYAMFVLTWVCGTLAAGVATGLAQRTGVPAPLANAVMAATVGIIMYPYFAIRADAKGFKIAPFWKWAGAWAASATLMYFITPFIMRLM